MKKITLLLLFALGTLKAISQNCDKFIEWDLDDLTIKKELPYNQTICLRLKSKKIDLSKITDVFILQHKGAKGVNASFDYYTNNAKKLTKRFNMVHKGEYDKENKTLDIQLSERIIPATTGSVEETRADIVLQPSKQYSIFLLTADPQDKTNTLLDSIRSYIDKKRSPDTSGAAAMKAKITIEYNKVGFAEGPIITDYFYTLIADKLIDYYEKNIYPYDLKIDSLNKVITDTLRYFSLHENKLTDSTTIFIEKNLSIIITKAGCIFQYPCEIDKCSLYKLLVALKERKEGTINKILAGKIKITDLVNPIFKEPKSVKNAERIANIDSSLFYLNNFKLYLNHLFINDCKTYSCCDSGKNRDWGPINKGIADYAIAINSIIEQLSIVKQLYLSVEETKTERLNAIRKERLDYSIAQIKTGNTLTYGLEPRNKLVILPVFGYAYYGFQRSFNSFTPYTGIVISLAPVNDTIEYRFLKQKTIAQRLSFLIGITLSSLKEDNKRDNLFSNGSNLMAGFGYKLNHVVNVNAGAIIFKSIDPNPFAPTKKVMTTPFVSLSINLKLKTLFEGLIGLIPGK